MASLEIFNALVPKDPGGQLLEEGIAYGPHPRQRLDVYGPAQPEGDCPVVFFSYGGSWASGHRQSYGFVGRALAARGFLTVIADYRLVPDVGFPAFVEDTAAALAWAVRKAPSYRGVGRVFLCGHSAGAYNVAMAALDRRYLESHGLDAALVGGVACLAGPFDFLPLDGPVTRAAFGMAPDLRETQPVNLVTPEAPAFLLTTGDRDRTVWPRNSQALAARLKAAGAEVVYRQYPGLSHAGILLALARPLRWLAPVLDDVTRFFAERQLALSKSPRITSQASS